MEQRARWEPPGLLRGGAGSDQEVTATRTTSETEADIVQGAANLTIENAAEEITLDVASDLDGQLGAMRLEYNTVRGQHFVWRALVPPHSEADLDTLVLGTAYFPQGMGAHGDWQGLDDVATCIFYRLAWVDQEGPDPDPLYVEYHPRTNLVDDNDALATHLGRHDHAMGGRPSARVAKMRADEVVRHDRHLRPEHWEEFDNAPRQAFDAAPRPGPYPAAADDRPPAPPLPDCMACHMLLARAGRPCRMHAGAPETGRPRAIDTHSTTLSQSSVVDAPKEETPPHDTPTLSQHQSSKDRRERLEAVGVATAIVDGKYMLVCSNCGWSVRARDLKSAEGHISGDVRGVSKCSGSTEQRKAQRSANHRARESLKRDSKNADRAVSMQANRTRDSKQRPGKQVTNAEAVNSRFRLYDSKKPDDGGRLPISATEAPRGTMGAQLPVIAFFEAGATPGIQEVDPIRSVYVHKLPWGKTPREIEAFIAAQSYNGYTLMNVESVVAALSASEADTNTVAFVPGVGPSEQATAGGGQIESMLWCYIHLRDEVYGVVVAELDGDPPSLRYRVLRRVSADEFRPYNWDRHAMEPFPGVELDPDATGANVAFALTDDLATVADETGPNSAVLNAGRLFVFCPTTQLFYGVVNLDAQADHDEHVNAAAAAMAGRQHAASTRRPVDVAAVSRPELMDLRAKLRPSNIHLVTPPPKELVELYLMKGGREYTPPVCREGAESKDCVFTTSRFSRKGRKSGRTGAEVQRDYKLITPFRVQSFVVKYHYCKTHNRWECCTGTVCGDLIGKNGVTLSVDVLFPMGSKHGITAAAVTLLCQWYATLGSRARVRRSFLDAWVRHREAELEAVMPSLSATERAGLRELAAQERLQMQADLPAPLWFQNVFLAVHFCWISPRVKKATKLLWLVCGQWVQIDFGHTPASNTLSTTSAVAGPDDLPSALDAGESGQGELRSADLRMTTRTRSTATFQADTMVAVGQGGFELVPHLICPTESHEMVSTLLLDPLMAHRLQHLGPFLGALSLISSDKMASDDAFFRSQIRRMFPLAYAEFSDYMCVFVQDLPHASRKLLDRLSKHCDGYSSMTFVMKDAFTRILCRDGCATKFALAVRRGILDSSPAPTKAVMGSLAAMRSKALAGSIATAERLGIAIDELLGVCLYRIIQNGSCQGVPRDVTVFFQHAIDDGLLELLPWRYLMSEKRYFEVIDLSIAKFGLTDTGCSLATGYVDGVATLGLDDARALYGAMTPPRPILAKVVAACGRDVEKYCPQACYIDTTTFVGEISRATTFYFHVWPATPEGKVRTAHPARKKMVNLQLHWGVF